MNPKRTLALDKHRLLWQSMLAKGKTRIEIFKLDEDKIRGSKKMVKVYNVSNIVIAEQVLAMLKEVGISAYRMESGLGSYQSITMGVSMTGFDIYVDESNAERARQIIFQVTGENDNEENRSQGNWKKRAFGIFALTMLGIGLLVSLLFY